MTAAVEQGRFRCFACDRLIRRKVPLEADTRDGQIVFVGPECFRMIAANGEQGYRPPKGGPRLYPVAPQAVESRSSPSHGAPDEEHE